MLRRSEVERQGVQFMGVKGRRYTKSCGGLGIKMVREV